MSKPRIMGAGLAGSTTVDVNVNGNQGGGSKKQGLPGITNMRSSLVFSVNQRAYGTPSSRDKVFYINQLSRVGPKSTMFSSTADGVQTQTTTKDISVFIYEAVKGINEVYGDNYEVVIAGESETLAADLNENHMDNSTVPDNFFQILQPGNELYEALPDGTKKNIDIANEYFGSNEQLLNNFYENGKLIDNLDYGKHQMAIIPLEYSDYKNELQDKGFGTVKLSFDYIDGVSASKIELAIYRKHHHSWKWWLGRASLVAIVAGLAVVGTITGGSLIYGAVVVATA